LGVFVLCYQGFVCQAQLNTTVRWNFFVDGYNGKSALLKFTATLDPGWHLYSQFNEENGPQPTAFHYVINDDYTPAGKPEETGKMTEFYDPNYEMKIRWYADQVMFTQKINLYRPATTVSGRIDFMTCNNQVCVPGKQNFAFEVRP